MIISNTTSEELNSNYEVYFVHFSDTLYMYMHNLYHDHYGS